MAMTKAQLEQAMEKVLAQNAKLAEQNESLLAMVQGAGVSAEVQETAKLFEPKQVRVEDSPELRAHLEDTFGLKPETITDKVANGKAGAMSNLAIKLDEKAGMVWFGHAYTRAFGKSEKGNNPVLFHGGGVRGIQVSRKLSSGEMLEISYGLPAWVVVRQPKQA